MSKRKCFSKNNCLTNGNIHGTNYDIIQPDFQGYRFTPKVEPMEAENDVIHPELVDEYREVIKAVVKEEGEESPNEEEATMKRKKREAKKKPASRRKTMTSRRSAGSSGRVRLSTKQKLDSSMGREAGAAEEDGESDEEATELSMQAQDPLSKAGRSLALKRKKSVKRCITINRMQIHQLCDSPNQETVDSILTKMPRMNVSGDSIATIDVMPCKDDKFFVVNGVNVWLAAKQADRKELEVLVWPSLTLAEIVLLRYQERDELKLGHWAPSHTQIVKDLRALMDASVIVFRANDFSSDHTISRRTASLKVAALPAFVKEFHVQIACKPAEQRDALVRLLELMEKTVWQRKSRKGPNRRGQVSILRQFFRNFVWSKHGKNLVKLIAQAEAYGTVFDIGDTALFSESEKYKDEFVSPVRRLFADINDEDIVFQSGGCFPPEKAKEVKHFTDLIKRGVIEMNRTECIATLCLTFYSNLKHPWPMSLTFDQAATDAHEDFAGLLEKEFNMKFIYLDITEYDAAVLDNLPLIQRIMELKGHTQQTQCQSIVIRSDIKDPNRVKQRMPMLTSQFPPYSMTVTVINERISIRGSLADKRLTFLHYFGRPPPIYVKGGECYATSNLHELMPSLFAAKPSSGLMFISRGDALNLNSFTLHIANFNGICVYPDLECIQEAKRYTKSATSKSTSTRDERHYIPFHQSSSFRYSEIPE